MRLGLVIILLFLSLPTFAQSQRTYYVNVYADNIEFRPSTWFSLDIITDNHAIKPRILAGRLRTIETNGPVPFARLDSYRCIAPTAYLDLRQRDRIAIFGTLVFESDIEGRQQHQIRLVTNGQIGTCTSIRNNKRSARENIRVQVLRHTPNHQSSLAYNLEKSSAVGLFVLSIAGIAVFMRNKSKRHLILKSLKSNPYHLHYSYRHLQYYDRKLRLKKLINEVQRKLLVALKLIRTKRQLTLPSMCLLLLFAGHTAVATFTSRTGIRLMGGDLTEWITLFEKSPVLTTLIISAMLQHSGSNFQTSKSVVHRVLLGMSCITFCISVVVEIPAGCLISGYIAWITGQGDNGLSVRTAIIHITITLVACVGFLLSRLPMPNFPLQIGLLIVNCVLCLTQVRNPTVKSEIYSPLHKQVQLHVFLLMAIGLGLDSKAMYASAMYASLVPTLPNTVLGIVSSQENIERKYLQMIGGATGKLGRYQSQYGNFEATAVNVSGLSSFHDPTVCLNNNDYSFSKELPSPPFLQVRRLEFVARRYAGEMLIMDYWEQDGSGNIGILPKMSRLHDFWRRLEYKVRMAISPHPLTVVRASVTCLRGTHCDALGSQLTAFSRQLQQSEYNQK